MKTTTLILTAGAFALAAASAALAQPASTDQSATPSASSPAAPAPQGQDDMGAQAPSAAAAGYNSSAVAATPDGVQAIRQGDNTLITNGPVPDTAANRAKYGGPMSMTGKRTKPAGN